MIEFLITTILNLPAIVQGALGSALFALLMYLGQRAFALLTKYGVSHSKAKRTRYLIEQQIKYKVLSVEGAAAKGAFVSLIVYRAIPSLFRALLWLSLGFIFDSFLSILGVVGYIGCLYYLFRGLSTVSPPEKVESVQEKLKEIKAELHALQ